MADSAVPAELTVVPVIVGMAGITVGRGALEDFVDMAVRARNLVVFTCQYEGCQVVVKGCRQPARGGVAKRTIGSKLTEMFVILAMTGMAIRGCTLEGAINVTCSACHDGMLPGQLKCRCGMIKSGGEPACWSMAGSAFRSILTVMLVILRVACITVHGGVLEVIVDVTIGTNQRGMFPEKLEGGQAVIEGHFQPAGWGVTGCAVGPVLALVNIAGSMAGITVRGSGGIIIVRMAAAAGSYYMFPLQRESKFPVGKVLFIENCQQSIYSPVFGMTGTAV